MFNKKKCPKCGEGIKEKFGFCPSCGNKLDEGNNWGMIGQNDVPQNTESLSNLPFGGGILNKMIGSAMKMMEQEMQKNMSQPKNFKPKTNLQLYVNGKKINLGNNLQQPIKKAPTKKSTKKLISLPFSKENLKKFSNLPREELKTKIRRLSDKIIYEIEMPEVKSIKDISISQLESSIEIKAIGKTKSYFKTIQIGLPIINYNFSTKKLILELDSKSE